MAEETFETLHGGGGATITTGVDLGAAVGASEAARQTAGGGDGGGGGADDRVLAMPPRLASFSVYYDEAAGGLKVFEPLVVAPTGEVEVTCPDEIGDGTYYCNVTRQTSGGEGYGAAVESSPASAAEGAEAVCSVKLFTVSGDEVTQYHTGAVVVGGGGGDIYLVGSDSVNNRTAKPVKSQVQVVSGTDSNVVATVEQDESTGACVIRLDVYYR